MHLEVLIGAVAKELRTARPEIGKVSPETYCSCVKVVVWWRWISACVIVVLLLAENSCK
jgi:hypothetical protein